MNIKLLVRENYSIIFIYSLSFGHCGLSSKFDKLQKKSSEVHSSWAIFIFSFSPFQLLLFVHQCTSRWRWPFTFYIRLRYIKQFLWIASEVFNGSVFKFSGRCLRFVI